MKKQKTLLQKAKKVQKNWREIDNETIELALAWAMGEITTKQATITLGYVNGNMGVYVTIARALKVYHSTNLCK